MLGKLAFLATVVLVAACGSTGNNQASKPAASTISTGAPVETGTPNTTYKPAFAGQTRIGSVTTKTPYEATAITTDLKRPWGIAVLPDGRLLITQKEGNMRIATTSGQLTEPITGLPPVNSKGQGGLLGLTVDPQFASNRTVYWMFSENTADGTVAAVAKGRLSSDDRSIENATVIYRATPAYNGDKHYGGRVIVDRSGNLMITTGERSDLPTRPQAQHLNSALGKVIRITKDGQPAAGNPFAGRADARPEIYSYGHRNALGMDFHPVTGELWISEMGPRGGDEINRIQPGKNYGWPIIGYGIEYSGATIGSGITQQEGMEQPVYYWDPVLSPGGAKFYRGSQMSEWKNNLFVCGLSSKHIARLVIDNNRVIGEERLLSGQGRFRDIAEGKDGALYAITDDGKLFRIAKK